MSRLSNPGQGAPIEVYTTNSNPGGTYNYPDGQFVTMAGMRFQAQDGRWFAIAANGSSALVAGKLVASPVAIAGHVGRTVASFTAYSANGNQPATVTFTTATTAVYSNQYAGGYLIVETNTGAGQTLRVASNTAAAIGGTVSVTLENPDGQNMVALDTTSTVSLYAPRFGSGVQMYDSTGATVSLATGGVVVNPTSGSNLNPIGLSTYAIPASTSTFASFGLVQTSGFVNALNQGGTTAGLDVGPSTSVAGAVATYAVATNTRVGRAVEAGTDAQYSLVYLQL